ncbi:MAG: rhodanese-like domain-containing protein [Alphaproteobacteria bacterium]
MKIIAYTALMALVMMPYIVLAADTKIYTDISAEELVELQHNMPTLVILDVRGEEQIADGMIKGAINLPVYHFKADTLKNTVPTLESPIVLYCNDIYCSASALAASKAYKLGYTNLYKYPGGIADWKEKNLPLNP